MQAAYLAQHAVDAVADAQEVLLGLEVDVRGAALHRVGEQRSDEPHDGLRVRVAGGLQALVVDLARFDLVQDAVDGEVVAVILFDRTRDLGLPREPQLEVQLAPEPRAHLVDRDDVVGVGDGDDQAAPFGVQRDGEDVVALGEVPRDQLQRRGVHHDLGQVDAAKAELLGQRIAQRGLGDEAQIDQQLADGLVGLELLEQGDAQLVLGQDALQDQDLPDVALGLVHGGRCGCAGRAHRGNARYGRSSCRTLAAACARSKPAGRSAESAIARR